MNGTNCYEFWPSSSQCLYLGTCTNAGVCACDLSTTGLNNWINLEGQSCSSYPTIFNILRALVIFIHSLPVGIALVKFMKHMQMMDISLSKVEITRTSSNNSKKIHPNIVKDIIKATISSKEKSDNVLSGGEEVEVEGNTLRSSNGSKNGNKLEKAGSIVSKVENAVSNVESFEVKTAIPMMSSFGTKTFSLREKTSSVFKAVGSKTRGTVNKAGKTLTGDSISRFHIMIISHYILISTMIIIDVIFEYKKQRTSIVLFFYSISWIMFFNITVFLTYLFFKIVWSSSRMVVIKCEADYPEDFIIMRQRFRYLSIFINIVGTYQAILFVISSNSDSFSLKYIAWCSYGICTTIVIFLMLYLVNSGFGQTATMLKTAMDSPIKVKDTRKEEMANTLKNINLALLVVNNLAPGAVIIHLSLCIPFVVQFAAYFGYISMIQVSVVLLMIAFLIK